MMAVPVEISRMTRTVEAIGVVSLAKILGVMGLLWGVIMAIVSLFVGVMGAGTMGGAELAMMLVGGPIYGIVTGAVVAIVYNAAASLIGGIELELA